MISTDLASCLPWTVLPDGTALGDIRYTLRTDDGDLLSVRSRAVRHGPLTSWPASGRGEDVDAREYTFRVGRSGDL